VTKNELYQFIRQYDLCVVSSVSPQGAPEAALVGYAVTPALELIFDTTDATRKCPNLRNNPHLAAVIGWADERTVQYEGIVDEPKGAELERLKSVYFEKFPDGEARASWPGLTYFRVKPTWIRYSCYYRPRLVEEFTF
jgi:pyridoxine/pyridoxamine 5'-phosphate oxidase